MSTGKRMPEGERSAPRGTVGLLAGSGPLALHTGVFLLAACALVLYNLASTPNDLWAWRPLARWGVLLAVHAAAVAVAALLATAQVDETLPSPRVRSARAHPRRTVTVPALSARPLIAVTRALPGASARLGADLGVAGRRGRERWRRDTAPRLRALLARVDGEPATGPAPAPPVGAGWSQPAPVSDAVGSTRAGARLADAGRLAATATLVARRRLVALAASRPTASDPPFAGPAAPPDPPMLTVPVPPGPTAGTGAEASGPALDGWAVARRLTGGDAGWHVAGRAVPVEPPAGRASDPSPEFRALERLAGSPPVAGLSGQDVVVTGPSPLPPAATDTDWAWVEAAAAAWLARREAAAADDAPPSPPSARTALD